VVLGALKLLVLRLVTPLQLVVGAGQVGKLVGMLLVEPFRQQMRRVFMVAAEQFPAQALDNMKPRPNLESLGVEAPLILVEQMVQCVLFGLQTQS
jgi:hypothetical protein